MIYHILAGTEEEDRGLQSLELQGQVKGHGRSGVLSEYQRAHWELAMAEEGPDGLPETGQAEVTAGAQRSGGSGRKNVRVAPLLQPGPPPDGTPANLFLIRV